MVGAALVEHPDVALIAFTGSRAVGLAINRRAARSLRPGHRLCVKHVIAEMGGKNAIIIDDDADLDEAVLGVVKSAFGYQGQKCSACSRCIVLADVYDAFLARLVEATRSLKIGPADDPATSVGPVIDAEACAASKSTSNGAAARRAKSWPSTSARWPSKAISSARTSLPTCRPRSRLAQEEIFGPVLAVIRAADLNDAIAIANGTDYALTGGIYSRSPANLDRAARDLRVGNLYLNRPITGPSLAASRSADSRCRASAPGRRPRIPAAIRRRTGDCEHTLRRGFASDRPGAARG